MILTIFSNHIHMEGAMDIIDLYKTPPNYAIYAV